MSTDLITYLNYMSTWEGASDEDINKIIRELYLFKQIDKFHFSSALDSEFNDLVSLATTLKNETIAADAIQIAADAAAVASIWSFGFGMAAFASLEAMETIAKRVCSKKSKELNKKMQTIDIDIANKIDQNVSKYIATYKSNNDLIARKASIGMDPKTCRTILFQFLACIEQRGLQVNPDRFRHYAKSCRILYNSVEINKVYDALDDLNMGAKNDDDIKKMMNTLVGLKFKGQETLYILRNVSIGIMLYKLNVANKKISAFAEETGIPAEEVTESAWEVMDACGKVVAVVAVGMSIWDVIQQVWDIADVIKQCNTMCDKLSGDVKTGYRQYFQGIKDSSASYKAAIAKHAKANNRELPPPTPTHLDPTYPFVGVWKLKIASGTPFGGEGWDLSAWFGGGGKDAIRNHVSSWVAVSNGPKWSCNWVIKKGAKPFQYRIETAGHPLTNQKAGWALTAWNGVFDSHRDNSSSRVAVSSINKWVCDWAITPGTKKGTVRIRTCQFDKAKQPAGWGLSVWHNGKVKNEYRNTSSAWVYVHETDKWSCDWIMERQAHL